ncbi:MAG: Com family DNA-binding transcriptional regulator [Gammaproteobacteria bacterium]|nr:Com family DNA-binding transcriptional regulator [Gammaproteobacteria bacterium]
MKQVRCKKCNKLLAVAECKNLEIKCPRCKYLNVFTEK